MNTIVRLLFILAVVLLGVVSMWTTYVSLHDSILPEPEIAIPLPNGVVWQCSIMALGMSVAIGIMLFALKVAVLQGEKRLNILGVVGMTIVAFISIAFNLDVLYRTADRDFFLRYSNDRMRSVYEEFLSTAAAGLNEKKTDLLRQIAKQQGELDAEVKGLRTAPSGYGSIAKSEDYKLTLLAKTAQVELDAVDVALETKEKADAILRGPSPISIDDVEKMQGQLRVECKDLAAASGVRLPEVVRLESPLFAVFSKLFDWHSVGFKEIFLMIIAFLMDLGDIIGYALVPNRARKREESEDGEPLRKRALRPLPAPSDTPMPVVVELPSAHDRGSQGGEPFPLPAENIAPMPGAARRQKLRIW